MTDSPTQYEIDQLAATVRQRKAMYESYARQWQSGAVEKHKLRIHEIIIEVVLEYYGRIVEGAVRQLHRLLD